MRLKSPIVKNSRPNKKLALRKQKFVLPEAFLNSLDEYAEAGYILILGNGIGEPEVHSNFDGTIQAMGLIKFGKDFLSSIDQKYKDRLDNHADIELD